LHAAPGRSLDKQATVFTAAHAGDSLLEGTVRQRRFDHCQPKPAWPITAPPGNLNLVISILTLD
jgi:hypothetical protein